MRLLGFGFHVRFHGGVEGLRCWDMYYGKRGGFIEAFEVANEPVDVILVHGMQKR